MPNISDADKALLADLPQSERDEAIKRLDAYLDGASFILPAAAPPLEDIVTAVLLAAGVEEAPDPGSAEEPTAEMVEARQRWMDQRFAVLGSLPTLEPIFARSAAAFLAHLVRMVTAVPPLASDAGAIEAE